MIDRRDAREVGCNFEALHRKHYENEDSNDEHDEWSGSLQQLRVVLGWTWIAQPVWCLIVRRRVQLGVCTDTNLAELPSIPHTTLRKLIGRVAKFWLSTSTALLSKWRALLYQTPQFELKNYTWCFGQITRSVFEPSQTFDLIWNRKTTRGLF